MNNVIAESLARFVRSYGHPCRVVANATRLKVASVGVYTSGPRKGKALWHIDTIPANTKAVRELLGY